MFIKRLNKNGIKYVLLAMLFLAVVFQPVNIYADTLVSNNFLFRPLSELPSEYQSYIDKIVNYYNLTLNNNYAVTLSSGTSGRFIYICLDTGNYKTNRINYNSGLFGNNFNFTDDNFSTGSVNRYALNYIDNSGNTVENYSTSSSSTISNITYLPNDTKYKLNVFSGDYSTGDLFVSSSNGSSINPNLIVNIRDTLYSIDSFTYQIQEMFMNNYLYYLTTTGSWRNRGFPAVGEALAYFMNCMQNPSSENVTYQISADELYENDESYQIINGDGYISRHNFLYDTTNQISDIVRKLNLAFPDNQAAINDGIGEAVLDNTDGNGLTLQGVISGKMATDEGINTYKLDVSGSQYSTPFAALNGGDWSFWSQTTQNNLGLGYTFTFDPNTATLMDGEDIVDSNKRNLLNLLGW